MFLMSAAAVPQSMSIPAVPGLVRVARAFMARVLGESHTQAEPTRGAQAQPSKQYCSLDSLSVLSNAII